MVQVYNKFKLTERCRPVYYQLSYLTSSQLDCVYVNEIKKTEQKLKYKGKLITQKLFSEK